MLGESNQIGAVVVFYWKEKQETVRELCQEIWRLRQKVNGSITGTNLLLISYVIIYNVLLYCFNSNYNYVLQYQKLLCFSFTFFVFSFFIIFFYWTIKTIVTVLTQMIVNLVMIWYILGRHYLYIFITKSLQHRCIKYMMLRLSFVHTNDVVHDYIVTAKQKQQQK